MPIRLTVKGGSENPYATGRRQVGARTLQGRRQDRAARGPQEGRKKKAVLPGKALEQKKTRVAKPRVIGAVKNSASKKAGSSVAIQKGARGGARQVSRSGRVRTGQKHAPKK